jgi:hypothetical protein
VTSAAIEEFPELKVVFVEGGFGWVPDAMWKPDRNCNSTRDDLPWLRKPPSEYLIDHIRFTTQPLPEPPTTEMLVNMLDMIHAERTLLFSSDYPHWDFEDPIAALSGIPAALRQRILIGNPTPRRCAHESTTSRERATTSSSACSGPRLQGALPVATSAPGLSEQPRATGS